MQTVVTHGHCFFFFPGYCGPSAASLPQAFWRAENEMTRSRREVCPVVKGIRARLLTKETGKHAVSFTDPLCRTGKQKTRPSAGQYQSPTAIRHGRSHQPFGSIGRLHARQKIVKESRTGQEAGAALHMEGRLVSVADGCERTGALDSATHTS
jgi:hypothetical protein